MKTIDSDALRVQFESLFNGLSQLSKLKDECLNIIDKASNVVCVRCEHDKIKFLPLVSNQYPDSCGDCDRHIWSGIYESNEIAMYCGASEDMRRVPSHCLSSGTIPSYCPLIIK